MIPTIVLRTIESFYVRETISLESQTTEPHNTFNQNAKRKQIFLEGTCVQLLLNKLWTLLDQNSDQVRIIQLLNKLFFGYIRILLRQQ